MPKLFHTRWFWAGVTLGALIALAHVVAYLAGEPLRRYVERQMNERLVGYTVRIGKLDIRPLTVSIHLRDTTVSQNARPDPPVAKIDRLGASVHWRALLDRRLVADFTFDRPRVYLDLTHVRQEAADKVPLKERGWQQALEAAYFDLKINTLKIVDGDLTYVDKGQFRPLRVSHLNFHAENIRNIKSKERAYPSDVRLDGIVFGTGRLSAEGHADFLAEPHAAMLADFKLDRVELDYFKPITNRYNLSVRHGILSTAGRFEYAPAMKSVVLSQVTVNGVQIDYVHTVQTATAERAVATKTARAARELSNHPQIVLWIDKLDIVGSVFGFVNRAQDPPYRVFLSGTDLRLRNLSNQEGAGTAVATLRGKFMGTGETHARALFLPERRGADLDLKLRVENVDLTGMNDLLLVHAGFDVVQGRLSLYSELNVNNGALSGYVKPLLKDLDVYDPLQDGEKSFMQQLFEALVGGASTLLRNFPRHEVSTVATVSGRLDSPQTDRWEIVGRLLQNAFFKAILPGFENESVNGLRVDRARVPGKANGHPAAAGGERP